MSDDAWFFLFLIFLSAALFANCSFDEWSHHWQCMALIERGATPKGCPVWRSDEEPRQE